MRGMRRTQSPRQRRGRKREAARARERARERERERKKEGPNDIRESHWPMAGENVFANVDQSVSQIICKRQRIGSKE